MWSYWKIGKAIGINLENILAKDEAFANL